MSKNVLLIGSEGFLGKNVKNILKKSNKINFFEISNSEDLDILDYDLFSRYLNKNDIDKIINCAAFVGGISYGYKYQADLSEKNTWVFTRETALE